MRSRLSPPRPSCSIRDCASQNLPEVGAQARRRSAGARQPGFLERLPDRPDLVVCGCETHVRVLQSVLGLVRAGRHVFLVRDAVGSRRAESKETALWRMEKNGAEVVATEMALFGRLATAEDPRLKQVLALVK